MQLVLLMRYHGDDTIFFEHRDVFSAKYEIFTRVDKHCKHFPPPLQSDDFQHIRQNGFVMNGVYLPYGAFITFDSIPSKNPKIRSTKERFTARVMEADIITIHEWFDTIRVGKQWSNLIDSPLKNSVDSSLLKL